LKFAIELQAVYLRGITYLRTPLFGIIPVVTLFVVCAGAVASTVQTDSQFRFRMDVPQLIPDPQTIDGRVASALHGLVATALMVLNNKLLCTLQQQTLRTHTVELYKNYNTLTILDLHDYQLCNLVHKFVYNKEKLLPA